MSKLITELQRASDEARRGVPGAEKKLHKLIERMKRHTGKLTPPLTRGHLDSED
jgi:hypothetical protein